MIQSVIIKEAPLDFVSVAEIELALTIAARRNKQIKGWVEITLVKESVIKQLNKHYRGINRPTDVLSFAWSEVTEPIHSSKNHLGQLSVCPSYIKRQAKRFDATAREEFFRSLTHGLLHLAGYDHLTKKDSSVMFAEQEKIIDAIGIKLGL